MLHATASPRLTLPALRGWPLFLVLSLLIHLLVVLGWQPVTPQQVATGYPLVPPLSVQIKSAPRTPEANTTASTSHQRKTAKSASNATPLHNLMPVIKPTVTEQRLPLDTRHLGTSQRLLDTFPDAGEPLDAVDNTRADAALYQQIESLIRTRFADHFVYPLVAQRHGWQGEVILAFHIGIDGSIFSAEVVRSSGHAVLDQAALDSLRAIRRIEFSPGMTLLQILELRMPVVYQIAQG